MRLSLLVFSALAVVTAAASAAPVTDVDNPAVLLSIEQYADNVDRLIARGEYRRALALIEAGLATNPLSVELRFQRCVTYEKMGDTATAERLLGEFIKTYPEIAEPYNNLATLLSARGQLDRAEELLKQALALRPDFALAHANLGNLYLVRARTSWQRSLSLSGKDEALRSRLNRLDTLLR